MANKMNYAEQWSDELLQIIDDGTYTSPFLTPNDRVKWLGAKTFHFTKMDVSGFKNHSRDGGYNRGSIVQEDKEFTLEHDRDIEFFVDIADVDETKQTANLQNVSKVFTQKHSAPETDARFFERVAAAAIADGFYETMSGFTAANTYSRLVKMFQRKELKKYRAMGGLIAYVSGEIMDNLENSTEVQKTLDIKTMSINEKQGIETRIAFINGVTIIEVVDDTRFNTKFDYSDGFVGNGSKINVCIAHPSMVKTVIKFNNIRFFANGTHTEGDGDLYQRRDLWDTFVFPNGLDGTCDAVYVNIESNEPSVRNYPTKTYNVNGQKLDASGTKAEITAGTDTDYIIKGTGAAGAVAPAAATAVYGSEDVKNNFIFMLEIDDNVTHYARNTTKALSGSMDAIPAGDIKVVDGTRYLIVAKGLTAAGAVYGGDYMTVGASASTPTKWFKIDASALVLA